MADYSGSRPRVFTHLASGIAVRHPPSRREGTERLAPIRRIVWIAQVDARTEGPDERLVRYAIARPELKKHWSPTEASFRRLLAWLDGGVDSGGEGYVEMRRRLVAYFDRRGCRNPDELADETLNRVSRRLEEVGSLTDGPPGRYCYIVAKFVFLEDVRRVGREGVLEVATDPARLESRPVAEDSADSEKRLTCLERCLDELAPRDRGLILEYYGQGQRNTKRRRELAARLGLTANALAIRACRIRGRLEECVRSCEAQE